MITINDNTAALANRLADDAHAFLRRIDNVRGQLRRSTASDARLEQWADSLVEIRNGIINEWQQVTGRSWETRGENYTP